MSGIRGWLERYGGAVFFMGCVIAFFYFSPDNRRPDPVANVECSFTALPDQAAVRMGEYSGLIETLEIAGALRDPFQETLHRFEGRARYQIGDALVTANARGSMFLDPEGADGSPGEPIGMIITIIDAKFTGGELKVITLNEGGTLDFDTERAFAFSSRDFRLAHPLAMRCETSPYEARLFGQETPF